MLSSQNIADDIYFSTHCILELTISFDTASALVQERFSRGIREQLTGLFQQIKSYEKEDIRKLNIAFQFPFTAKIFKGAQPLEMVITCLYVMVLGIQKKHGYVLFDNNVHLAYAQTLIENNHLKLKGFL